MKKKLTFILCSLLVAAMLFGCGAVSKESASISDSLLDAGYGNSMGSTSNSLTDTSGSTTLPQLSGQKLVRKLRLYAETENLDELLTAIDSKIQELSGYVEAREVYNGSQYDYRRYRNAEMTIRIPVEQMDSFIAHVTESANITSSNETVDNITLSYVATQSRITALETEQTRLLELLSNAENMSDLLEIEKRLTDVRTELEEVTSQLRLYDNLVDYGTITLSISEVREYTVVEEPETVWEKIGAGFMESLENIGDFFVGLFVFVIVSLPYLFIIACVATPVILLIRHRKKKRNKTA